MSEATEPSKPSKKELSKLAKKEKKTAPKSETSATTLVVQFCKSLQPDLTRSLEQLISGPYVKYTIDKTGTNLPFLVNTAENNGSLSGDANIARYLMRSVNELSYLYANMDAFLSSQIDQWLDVYSFGNASGTSLLTVIESHLTDKTYLVGDSVTAADVAIVLTLNKAKFVPSSTFPNVSRWYELTSLLVPTSVTIPITFVPTAVATTPAAGAATGSKEKKPAAETESAIEDGATCPALVDAVDGQVCTRFPPEPSGYLHIGHAKAVLLNQYYAQRYNGRLLVRFDDTNPSKEKEEFEENIMGDLITLGVKPHAVCVFLFYYAETLMLVFLYSVVFLLFYYVVVPQVSHSSDHFGTLEEIARRMIKEGKAYMDDTDQETMQVSYNCCITQ